MNHIVVTLTYTVKSTGLASQLLVYLPISMGKKEVSDYLTSSRGAGIITDYREGECV